MANRSKASKVSKELCALIEKAQSKLPAKPPVALKNLLEVIALQIPLEDLELFDENILADVTVTHWDLAREREDGDPKLRIYCPFTSNSKYRKTLIDVVSDDYSFLIDSIIAEINRHNLLIDLLVHPGLYAHYDKNGALRKIDHDCDKDCIRQSHIHIQIKEALPEDTLQELHDGLVDVMHDVLIANRDWKPMLARLDECREELANAPIKRPLKEIQKYCNFLSYLYNNNFTLLGYREYKFVEKKGELTSKTLSGKGLGLLADDVKPAYVSDSKEGLPRNLQEMRRRLDPVSISKTNRLSTVHRRVPMDAIAIKTYDNDGNVTGEKLFLGLFTSVTYSRSVSSVPYLREKVDEVLEMSAFIAGSHERKALRHILEKYPRDELFQIDPKELLKIVLSILRLQEKQRIALFMRKDPFGRYISCLIYIPRDRFSSDLRARMIKILEEELNGKCGSFFTNMDDSVFARISVTVNINQSKPPKYNEKKLEERLQETGKTWQEKLSSALFEAYEDRDKILDLTERYSEAFPVAYAARYKASQSIFDIEKIECVLDSRKMELDLYRPQSMKKSQMRLKIYNPGAPITLSDVMPILGNMGLKAISELPFEILPENENTSVWIHDFLLERPGDADSLDIKAVKENFERAFTKVWYGEVESDGLNRLILTANMNWHEITILRSYVRYLKQILFPYSRAYTETALTENPKTSRLLVNLFKAFHNPGNKKTSAKKAEECSDAIEEELKGVESLDQDKILRIITRLTHATLRTNYYQRKRDGTAKTYLSLKLDSKKVPDMPEPRPFVEVFVYSPYTEGIHLRGDKIARGGLRWSDRHEDFRTEILGLMKAQMVKNAVIVPTGAKGGFVVKTKINDREKYRKEGVRCYKIFIKALLDITDNRVGGKIVPPPNVVRRDDDDPYLVVAADKGTATFSDIANQLSKKYDFWLDDAFASGGSAGYDHKKMGITAKGAWESVKAHFRSLNHNIQEKPFDVIGIGDMSGDVFGNGMLLSNHIRLIGAFNHLHIVCDPDPDPAVCFKERERLFKSVSGWDEYNTAKLSKGGRIYSRKDKLLELTPEIKARFDIDKDKVVPSELISAMLKARTDLLWFGGIGTYIKSSQETNLDAGDKANDGVRVSASEVRAKVIGEGANLAVTQRGRIEFAEKGGRINTDFLDNSGGVDCSDHEVNIKILLTEVMCSKKHKMTLGDRNKLLEEMTGSVSDLVLRSNYQQALAISLAESQARHNLQLHEEFIEDLEKQKGISREIEGLPDEETFEARIRSGKGLTRPELCVLLAYAKINFTNELLLSDIPDNPNMEEWIVYYFPKELRKKYYDEIMSHRLRREIISTTMANSLINRMGPTFLKSRMNKTGAGIADIAKAYIIVRDAFNLRPLWDGIEALDYKVPAELQLKAMKEIARLSEHAITWFLIRLGREVDISNDPKQFGESIDILRKNMLEVVNSSLQENIKIHMEALHKDGLPKDLAREIAIMPALASACDIVKVSVEEKTDLLDTARTYYELGERFHLDWLRQQARHLKTDDVWQNEASGGLVDQLYSSQAGMTVRILRDTECKVDENKSTFDCWCEEHEDLAHHLDPLFADLRRAGTVDLSMLVIAEQRLRHLYGG